MLVPIGVTCVPRWNDFSPIGTPMGVTIVALVLSTSVLIYRGLRQQTALKTDDLKSHDLVCGAGLS